MTSPWCRKNRSIDKFFFFLVFQLEDAECARNAALKARQALESELADANASLEDVQRARNDAEDRAAMYAREKTQLQSQLDENEEELAEVNFNVKFILLCECYAQYVRMNSVLI